MGPGIAIAPVRTATNAILPNAGDAASSILAAFLPEIRLISLVIVIPGQPPDCDPGGRSDLPEPGNPGSFLQNTLSEVNFPAPGGCT